MKDYPKTKEWIIPSDRGYGHFWLSEDGWITSDEIEVEDVRWASLELSEFIAKLNAAGAVFIGEPSVSVDAHDEYDLTIPTVTLSGLRRATDEESQWVEQWVADEPERKKEAGRQALRDAETRLAQVRAQYPDADKH